QLIGTIIKYCLEEGKGFEGLTLSDYQKFSSSFGEDVFGRIKLDSCVFNKESAGGTGKKSLARQIKEAKEAVSNK
ncbi:unnamed protein product, partial [marine sediment metagenome]